MYIVFYSACKCIQISGIMPSMLAPGTVSLTGNRVQGDNGKHCAYRTRARKLYTSARIYEWKFGKGEWKLPFASPTGRVNFYGFVIIFEEKKKN